MASVIHLEVSWGDCDPAGIVFYPNYFAYFNRATDAFFGGLGVSLGEAMKRHGILGWPMLETRSKFIRPSRYGDILSIETDLVRLGRSSFGLRHRLRGVDGELRVEGHDERVWARDEAGVLRAEPIAPVVRERLIEVLLVCENS